MTAAEALAFIERHGIVLESGRHDGIPSLAEAIAGAPIRGNWWAHPQGRIIFAVTRAVRAAPEVLVCRLVDGKISFVHQRLWPALVRIADRLAPMRLARLHERHTERGAHRVEETPFPDWLDTRTIAAARRWDAAAALAAFEGLSMHTTTAS